MTFIYINWYTDPIHSDVAVMSALRRDSNWASLLWWRSRRGLRQETFNHFENNHKLMKALYLGLSSKTNTILCGICLVVKQSIKGVIPMAELETWEGSNFQPCDLAAT
jgi:hypothetical protein